MTGATDWGQFRLGQIWEMVKNESSTVGTRQNQAWRNTTGLCDQQADQLERAAAQLAETWVPTPGSAAQAFQDWLRTFTLAMRRTASVADANAVVIADITGQMVTARDRVFDLVIQHNHYQAAEDSQLPPATKLGEPRQVTPSTDVERPPDEWRTLLDQQARDIMLHTESTVLHQATRIQHDPPYVLRSGVGETFDPHEDGITISGSTSAGRPSPYAVALPVPAYPPIPVIDTATDPVLAGQEDQPRTTSPSTEPLQRIPMINTAAGPTLAPGGLIGAPAATPGSVGSGRTAAFGGAASGPVGPTAVSARTAPGSMPTAPMIPPGGARPGVGGGARSSRVSTSAGRRRRPADPDDPWFVASGGPGVLEPAQEPDQHDPGPGVIGIDR